MIAIEKTRFYEVKMAPSAGFEHASQP